MARIAIFCDIEEGHLFPTFSFARRLSDRGHSVIYITLIDNRRYVESAGFECETIFERDYPAGSRALHQKLLESGSEKRYLPHLNALMNGELDDTFRRLNPDLLMTIYFLPLEAMMLHYRYRVPQVLLTTALRHYADTPGSECVQTFMALEGATAMNVVNFIIKYSGAKPNKLKDLVTPIEQMQELLLCPADLEIPSALSKEQTVSYVGPSIRDWAFSDIDLNRYQDKPALIYVTFGSQVGLFRKYYVDLIRIINVVAASEAFRDLRFVVSLGRLVSRADIGTVAPNVVLEEWVPQLEILKQARLAIIHGGLGTIKECISSGVPILTLPLSFRDQPKNAERIVFHRLGLSANLETIDSGQLIDMIQSILNCDEILKSVLEMRDRFIVHERSDRGVELVEKVIDAAKEVAGNLR